MKVPKAEQTDEPEAEPDILTVALASQLPEIMNELSPDVNGFWAGEVIVGASGALVSRFQVVKTAVDVFDETVCVTE